MGRGQSKLGTPASPVAPDKLARILADMVRSALAWENSHGKPAERGQRLAAKVPNAKGAGCKLSPPIRPDPPNLDPLVEDDDDELASESK